MPEDLNVAVLVGNVTRDVELRKTGGGTSVANVRLASTSRRPNPEDPGGRWIDVPNYFDVIVWAGQAEALAPYLLKGQRIGVTGRLQWREWEADDGGKRQAVELVADVVQLLGGPRAAEGDGAAAPSTAASEAAAHAHDWRQAM